MILIAGKTIGRIEIFKLSGPMVATYSNSITEIKVLLAILRQVMRQLTKLWKSAEIDLKLKKQIEGKCLTGKRRTAWIDDDEWLAEREVGTFAMPNR